RVAQEQAEKEPRDPRWCLVLTKVRYFFHRNEQDRQQDAEHKAIRAAAQDGRPGAQGRGLVLPVVAPPLVPMRIVGGWGWGGVAIERGRDITRPPGRSVDHWGPPRAGRLRVAARSRPLRPVYQKTPECPWL